MRREQSLNGIWDFAFAECGMEEIEPQKISFSEVITVPGCFDALPEYFGKRGTGVYRRFVECSGPVKLSLEAIGLRAKIYWDRKEIASSEHPYSPEAFVFSSGTPGKHELMIFTDNRMQSGTSALFYPYYDFYGYGGIYRGVTLTELPSFYIDRAAVIPENIEDGTVRISLVPGGEVPERFSLGVRFDTSEREEMFELAGDHPEIRCRVPSFKLWSTETPHLHEVTLSLPDDSIRVEFGIRKVECREGKILLNGNPVKLIGYNRHESHPEFGSATPDFLACSDLRMIKEQGCNLIRGCHYKQNDFTLSLCDRLGLLVWEESLGWGNREEQFADPDFCRLQREQTVAMVRRSINHPSVILWGFLNECASNKPLGRACIQDLCESIRREDDSRLITFASNRTVTDISLDLVDVISFNTYPGWYDGEATAESGIDRVVPELERLAAFAGAPEYRDKPLLISEIGAAAICGDHSGMRWSEEYQSRLLETAVKYILESPRYSGIAMWQFCNAKTYITTQGVLTRPRGFNNKGVVDEFRRPKLAWKTLTGLLRK